MTDEISASFYEGLKDIEEGRTVPLEIALTKGYPMETIAILFEELKKINPDATEVFWDGVDVGFRCDEEDAMIRAEFSSNSPTYKILDRILDYIVLEWPGLEIDE